MAKKKAAKKRVNKKVCRLCGHPLGETFVYSRFTKSRYCMSLDACDKRRAAQGAPRRGNSTSAELITSTHKDTEDATKKKAARGVPCS